MAVRILIRINTDRCRHGTAPVLSETNPCGNARQKPRFKGGNVRGEWVGGRRRLGRPDAPEVCGTHIRQVRRKHRIRAAGGPPFWAGSDPPPAGGSCPGGSCSRTPQCDPRRALSGASWMRPRTALRCVPPLHSGCHASAVQIRKGRARLSKTSPLRRIPAG